MRFPRTILVLALVGLGLALPGCGDDDASNGDGSGGSAATTAPEPSGETPEPSGNASAPSDDAVRAEKVEIVEFAYDPDPVTIEAGGKVIWTNRDSAPHTATADDGSFDTETLEEGKLKSESFKEPGTFTYFCEIHPTMHGTVEVVEPG
jgi:plastocyanin